MPSYGRLVVANIGTSVRVSADGNPSVKIGGVTIDWTTVAQAPAALTLIDGVQILVNDLYLRYGQVITKITNPAIDVVTLNGNINGGTFAVTVASEINGVTTTLTTTPIPYNASAAAVQNALVALANVGVGNVTVTGNNGGPYTLTFTAAIAFVTVTTDNGANLTVASGAAATITVTATSAGGNIDKYGPYDPTATDGRGVLTMGAVFILDRTVKFNDLYSDHPPGVIYGGLAWQARVIQSGIAAASLAAGPTLATLLAVMPDLQMVTDNTVAG